MANDTDENSPRSLTDLVAAIYKKTGQWPKLDFYEQEGSVVCRWQLPGMGKTTSEGLAPISLVGRKITAPLKKLWKMASSDRCVPFPKD